MIFGRWKASTDLCRLFSRFNKKFFDGKLVGEIRVGWRDPIIKGHAGELIPPIDGKPAIILLNPKLKEINAQKYAMSTLLHEMAHFHLWVQGKSQKTHGPYFQNEMKRLADIGAFKDVW